MSKREVASSRRPPPRSSGRRPPPRGAVKTHATAVSTMAGHTDNVTGGEVKPRTEVHVLPLDDIPDGDAFVEVQHGAKTWGQHRQADMGMTVESTSRVHIPCARDEVSMSRANDKASDMALEFAERNAERTERALSGFLQLSREDFFRPSNK